MFKVNYEYIPRGGIEETENSYHQLDKKIGIPSLDNETPETLVENNDSS